MSSDKKKLIIVGDRVLIEPLKGEEKTSVGLFLPKSAVEDMPVQQGLVVAVGPGIPIGMPNADDSEEPWRQHTAEPKYFPCQAKVRDKATFFRRAAVEVKWEGKDYLLIPQQAILLLERPVSNHPEVGEFMEAEAS
jgi:chaperonin GroES